MPIRFLATTLALLTLLPMSAGATLINPTTWQPCLLNTNSCVIGNASLSTNERNFREKTVDGQQGLGIDGGRTGGEIDIDETLYIDYGISEIISGIRIVFIYNGPEFKDVAEIAQISANGSSYTLSVDQTLDNVASWTGMGSVSSCGDTTSGGSGCFDISNPFGDLAVNSLTFTALLGNAPTFGDGTNESDFSLGSVRGAQVPEPGTLALLGTGLLGLGLTRRRRSA